MTALEGQFQDGKSSASRPARLLPWPKQGRVTLQAKGIEQEYPLHDLDISDRVGNIPRRIGFPDGTSFETLDNDAVDELLREGKKNPWARFAHQLESHSGWVLTALVLTAVVVWSSITLGIPWLAEKTAYAIPIGMETQMGDQTLQSMDSMVFSPTTLNTSQQGRGKRLLGTLLVGHEDIGFRRLEFRAMKGNVPNAFALPSGLIIVTDRLMELAGKDEELQAVFAHELGHIHYRHSLRSWLQNSVAALIVAGILGDISSISANVAVLPTLLLENHYSKEFELQADDYAVILLENKQIDICHMVAVLSKLETSLPKDAKNVPDFLSTHPATDQRLLRIQEHRKVHTKLSGDCEAV